MKVGKVGVVIVAAMLAVALSATCGVGAPPVFEVTGAMLQYRTYPDPADTRYEGWIGLLKDGVPIVAEDVTGMTLIGPGGPVPELSEGVWSTEVLLHNCFTGTCTAPFLLPYINLYARYANLLDTTYTFEVLTSDGQVVTADVYFPATLALPVLDTATMNQEWVSDTDGDGSPELKPSWVNPETHPEWSFVDELRVFLWDADGKDRYNVKLAKTANMFVIPSSILSQLPGNTSLLKWEVHIRAYDNNGMNYARGYSEKLPILSTVCDIQMSQPTYVDGDTIQADVLRIANPGPEPVAVEWKVWLGIPGVAPIGLINLGAVPPGSLTLPSGLDFDLGPLPLIPVTAGLPRGMYELSCRLLDPVTGALLAEDLNPFEVQ